MKTTTRLLVTCATGGAIIATGSWAARAADQAMPVKAPVVVEEGWWYKGYIELGARGFLNDPKRDGVKGNGTGDSLAKFYEYRDLREGGFGNGWFATGSKNGLYQFDGWAKNVGYTDQAYELNWSKAGEHYLTVDWDQTPHVYSTSALTPYFGVGTNQLTLAPGLSATLFGPAGAGCVAAANAQPAGCGTLGAAAAARVQTILNGSLHQTDLGITRDTGSVEYRYTPTDDWDVRVNYSLLHRFGTQVDGVAFSPGTSGVRVDAPRPIDDITQNYGASGEYVGTSPWSQRYTFKLGYSGSTYTNRWDSYTVENPFCPAGAATNVATQGFCARNGSASTPIALVSLAPDNQTNGGSATLGADLPYKSRYMGTFSYNVGTQNNPFLPFGSSPVVLNAANVGVAAPHRDACVQPQRPDQHAAVEQRADHADHAGAEEQGELPHLRLRQQHAAAAVRRLGRHRRQAGLDHRRQQRLCAEQQPAGLLHQAERRRRAGVASEPQLECRRGLQLGALRLEVRVRSTRPTSTRARSSPTGSRRPT